MIPEKYSFSLKRYTLQSILLAAVLVALWTLSDLPKMFAGNNFESSLWDYVSGTASIGFLNVPETAALMTNGFVAGMLLIVGRYATVFPILWLLIVLLWNAAAWLRASRTTKP